jgi:hypothetical protein
VTRESGPKAAPQIFPRRNTQHEDTSAARIYRDEVDGRLRAIGCAEVAVRRGELGRAEADELIAKLATRACQWILVYEAERELAR